GYRKVGHAIAIYFIVKFYFAINYIRLQDKSFFVHSAVGIEFWVVKPLQQDMGVSEVAYSHCLT
ncbi:MAG: hypothetical protein H0X31_07675, partial [Nostocaceae cyanobacterium]|nr:hypothetical protein [Nostocaceae cyanobacterium]